MLAQGGRVDEVIARVGAQGLALAHAPPVTDHAFIFYRGQAAALPRLTATFHASACGLVALRCSGTAA